MAAVASDKVVQTGTVQKNYTPRQWTPIIKKKKMHAYRLSYLDLARRREVRNNTVTAGGAVQR
jgi:hypothetical protein